MFVKRALERLDAWRRLGRGNRGRGSFGPLNAATLAVAAVIVVGGAALGQVGGGALVVREGDTAILEPGAHDFETVELYSGAAIVVTGTTTINAAKMVTYGDAQIRYERRDGVGNEDFQPFGQNH